MLNEDRTIPVRIWRVARYSKEVSVPADVAEAGENSVWEWLADHE